MKVLDLFSGLGGWSAACAASAAYGVHAARKRLNAELEKLIKGAIE